MNAFERDGFALVSAIFSAAECRTIAGQIETMRSASAGTRRLLLQDGCRSLVVKIRQHPALSSLLSGMVAVQCTFFEKSASRNWLVAVHQDLSIPVAERIEHPALHGWSVKEGQLYVQAPVEVLQQLIAVRIHLDVCGAEDGPLRIVPGSHLQGLVTAEDAAIARGQEIVCVADAGSILLMRPLLLHSSSKSLGTSQRRVLHFLFASFELPFGLRWSDTV
ncbi:phytanoyl-CoA dioxygenase family protein [Iodobacter fluviatilis]|uniref:Phytanoyl-CoA dioxygenase (PhyH) n=1 Tax=Iodobacter fluviatilis TaxID=537 RepID=A0A377SU18_9NEIS|nr:phytanoyl-CoA dioxygenase family protein [Iodobacter fluviatilis]TCU82066.1 phytanoyl-CoA dioxygenase PhyH [Iodobacter fluviatilis]STR44840.1 Phytanoyl-CoA dioxygenase (PhyH) [Iodobacter fluviatilis]